MSALLACLVQAPDVDFIRDLLPLFDRHCATCHGAKKQKGPLRLDSKESELAKASMEETMVLWGSEIGRTPGVQVADGRDPRPFGIPAWPAGGGIKGGFGHRERDEIGFHAAQNRHDVTDLHATVLHLCGLDSERLVIPVRKRLNIGIGTPIREIIAA